MTSVTFETDLGPLTITEKVSSHYYRRGHNAEDTTAEIERRVRWEASIRVQHPSKKALWDIRIPAQEDGSIRENRSSWRSSNFRGSAVDSEGGWTYLRSNWRSRERDIEEVAEPLLKAYVGSKQQKMLVLETVIDYMRREIQRELDRAEADRLSSIAAHEEAKRLQGELEDYLKGEQTDGNV